MSKGKLSVLLSSILVAAGAVATIARGPEDAQDPQILREGEGARRLLLNKSELKPFNADHWNKLSEWTNGKAVTSADTTNKVVLIVTWASWSKTSVKAMEKAKTLAEDYAKKDLVVVAVHDKADWKEAAKPAAAEGAKFLIALDAKNEFRKAIDSDQDPDFYLIDKAGQLRYADIATEAVEGAVKKLTGESAAAAGKINERLAADAKAAEDKARETLATRAKVDLSKVPEVSFKQPSEAEYAIANWPDFPLSDSEDQEFKRSGKKPDPRPFVLPDGPFFSESNKKPNTKGRMIVAYFFHPDQPNADRFVANAITQLNLFQRQNARDMVVVGIVCDVFSVSNNGGSSEKDAEHARRVDPELMSARLKEFAKTNKLEHSVTLDLENTLLKSILPTNNQGKELAWPFIVLASSDGVLRWYRAPGTGAPIGPIDRILAEDPGIRNRRAAEEAWLKAHPEAK